MEPLIDKFKEVKILVVGDIILDQYMWGKVDRISPEAPIPIVEVIRESYSLGGAANVAANISSLGAKVILAGLIGNDDTGKLLIKMAQDQGIDTGGIVKDKIRTTTLKTRIIAHEQQIVRVDREETKPPEDLLLDYMINVIKDFIPHVDAVIIEDYGKGVIQNKLLKQVISTAKNTGKIITVDPKKNHMESYVGVTAITPNQNEAEIASGIDLVDETSLFSASADIMKRLDCEAVLITLGSRGMHLLYNAYPYLIPAQARQVFDVSGAGDTVIAVFTTALVAGVSFLGAAKLSNIAGGMVVEKVGTATINPIELIKRSIELNGNG